MKLRSVTWVVDPGKDPSAQGFGLLAEARFEPIDSVLEDLGDHGAGLRLVHPRPNPVPLSPGSDSSRSGLLVGAAGAPPTNETPLPTTLMEEPRVVLGTDAGNFYCEHAFYVALGAARQAGVRRNRAGERLVGFLHIPGDAYSYGALGVSPHETANRHRETITVVGNALSGYIEAAAERRHGPIRILLSGFGPWESVVNNPSGDFVANAENLDAAMRTAFGDGLLSTPGLREVLPNGDTARAYTIRDQFGARRTVIVMTRVLPVDDTALDPEHPASLPSAMRSFRPHAVLSLGQGGSEYAAEQRADSGGLRLDAKPAHDASVAATEREYTNRSLARAILSGARRSAPQPVSTDIDPPIH